MNDLQKQILIDTIKKVLPAVIKEMNEIRLPALEQAWGRKFKQELSNEKQVTVEVAKNYVRPLNNVFFRHIKDKVPTFEEHTTDGSDYVYNGVLIEDKNSFSDANCWVGNGFTKTPIHILKKFQVDENGKIIKAFIAIVDLSKCSSSWSAKTLKDNRSIIQFTTDDAKHIDVIVGKLKLNRKYIKPIMVSV